MNLSTLNNGAMRTVLGCAGLALVLSLNGCGDADRNQSTTANGINLGVLSAQQTADVFLFNDGDDELSVTLTNNDASPRAKAARVAERTAAKGNVTWDEGNDLDCCHTMRLKKLLQTKYPQGMACKSDGEIVRNTIYTDLKKGETTDMWIDYSDSEEMLCQKFPFQKLCDTEELSDIIVMAQVVDGKPVFTEENAKQLNDFFGKRNPYDTDGLSIRQRVNDTFGTEWRQDGGKDGTEKMILAVVSQNNFPWGGYYWSIDATDEEYSNRGEIFYMSAKEQNDDPQNFWEDQVCTLAHEYQHMCHCNQRYIHDGKFDGQDEESIVDEGCSVLTEQMVGLGLECQKDGVEIPCLYSHMHFWLDFLSQGWFYQFGDYWWYTSEDFGGTLHGCYGQAGFMMRYIADNLGFDDVQRIARGYDADDQPMDDTGIPGVEKATNQDFVDIGLKMMVAGRGYKGAPQGLSFTNLEFRTYNVQVLNTEGTEVQDIDLEPLTPMDEVSAGDLANEQIKLKAHTGGFVRIVGDGKTPLVLKNSALNADSKGAIVVSKDNAYEKHLLLK